MQQEKENTDFLEGITSYWTERAHSYSASNIAEMNDWRRGAWRRLILENAPKKGKLRILDVGTGPGFFAINLALAGHQVTAVDVTEHMLWHAKRNAADYGATVNFVLHRGEELPFADDSFDLIVSRNVTWNLEYPEQALTEWKRVLAPGGRMVYFDANWYLYLFDNDLRARREKARRACQEKHPGYTGAGDMPAKRLQDLERIAYDLPLSRQRRPAWDRETLHNLNMKLVCIDREAGRSVQAPDEWDYDLATPIFMVCAEKPLSPEQEQINAHWTKGSENYDRIIHDELASFRMEGWQKLIAAQVDGRTGLEVLDCGCGPAFFTILLSKAGYHVTGIDAAEGMLEKARRNVAEYGVDARILEMDCHRLDFPAGSFDLVVSRNVTHALRDHVQVYSEWRRVLKPGGILLIFDANWHLAVASEEWIRESVRREKECIRVYGSDFSGNTTFDEDRARRAYESEDHHRLGDLQRPDWDCGILQALGFQNITYDRDITGPLWDDKEKLIYGHTPMFLLRAEKRTSDDPETNNCLGGNSMSDHEEQELMHSHEHEHSYTHAHPHVHEDGSVDDGHTHEHSHSYSHSHEHCHDHGEEHTHTHPHEHDPEHEHAHEHEAHHHHHDHGAEQPAEKLHALMHYMAGHNRDHTKELEVLAGQVKEAGNEEAYAAVMDAVRFFDQGNEALARALEKI